MKGRDMEFLEGDKIVHPHHGPGHIEAVERREFLAGEKEYYVINIPSQHLTVYLPRIKAGEMGLRHAIPLTRLPRVLAKLRSTPRHLDPDYKERQEKVWDKLCTSRVMPIAEVVRDLTYHRERAYLTKRDTDLLIEAKQRLAAELALVSGEEIDDMEHQIEQTMAAAVAAWPGLRQDTAPVQ